MYSTGDKNRSAADLAVVIEGVMPNQNLRNLSAEVAAKLFNTGWTSGGMTGPYLTGSSGLSEDGVDVLMSSQSGLKAAGFRGLDAATLLVQASIKISTWTVKGIDQYDAVPLAMAWILLTGIEE